MNEATTVGMLFLVAIVSIVLVLLYLNERGDE
jgi:hypothetical protein